MPVRTTPEDATKKWVDRLSGSTAEIQAGVARVTQAPGVAAAAKYQKWLSGLQNSQEKWRRNVAAVSLADWQQSMTSIGVQRIAQGAQAKQGKYQRFMAEFIPHLERGQQALRAMDDTTLEARIQRAVAMMRHNATFRRGGAPAARV